MDEWSSVLNELKFDEKKWKKIEEDCNQTLKDLTDNLRKVETKMFMNKLEEQKFDILNFEEANIEPILKKKVIFLFDL